MTLQAGVRITMPLTTRLVVVVIALAALLHAATASCPQSCSCSASGFSSQGISIDCTGRGLVDLPDFSNLPPESIVEELIVSNNFITRVPDDAFVNMTQLQVLRLDQNLLLQVNHIALRPLTQLRILSMGKNPFRTAYVNVDTFANMPLLGELNLGSRPQQDTAGLNMTLYHFRNNAQLGRLIVDFNPIICRNSLSWDNDDVLALFSNIYYLSMTSCSLEEIPPFISILPQLHTLHLGFNRITSTRERLPAWLKDITITSNRISQIFVGDFPFGLDFLGLGGNPVREIGVQVFRKMPRLRTLELVDSTDPSLSFCDIVAGRPVHVQCRCGQGLFRSSRGDACTACPETTPGHPDFLCSNALTASTCTVPCGAFANIDTPLHEGYHSLFICEVREDKVGWHTFNNVECGPIICDPRRSPCNCSADMSVISCENVGISDIPGGVPSATRELRLSGNNIGHIPRQALLQATGLESIDLSFNVIRDISEHAFDGAESLAQINLSRNSITQIGLNQLPRRGQLTQVNLAHNAIVTIQHPSVLTQSLMLRMPEAQSAALIGSILPVLNMDGNPLECKVMVLPVERLQSAIHARVQCSPCISVPALNNSAFCPVTTEPEFACAKGDFTAAISFINVCDGVVDCQPSQLDEKVCQGLVAARPLGPSHCRDFAWNSGVMLGDGLSSDDLAATCNTGPEDASSGFTTEAAESHSDGFCAEEYHVTVDSGVVRLRPSVPCVDGHLCPEFVGVVTGVGSVTTVGSIGTTVLDIQGDRADLSVAPDFNSSLSTVEAHRCVLATSPLDGDPFAISLGPTKASKPTTTSVATTESAFSRSPSTMKSPTTGPVGSEDTAPLSMQQQVTIVVAVSVALAVALFAVAMFLLHRRKNHIQLEEAFVRNHTGSGGLPSSHFVNRGVDGSRASLGSGVFAQNNVHSNMMRASRVSSSGSSGSMSLSRSGWNDTTARGTVSNSSSNSTARGSVTAETLQGYEYADQLLLRPALMHQSTGSEAQHGQGHSAGVEGQLQHQIDFNLSVATSLFDHDSDEDEVRV